MLTESSQPVEHWHLTSYISGQMGMNHFFYFSALFDANPSWQGGEKIDDEQHLVAVFFVKEAAAWRPGKRKTIRPCVMAASKIFFGERHNIIFNERIQLKKIEVKWREENITFWKPSTEIRLKVIYLKHTSSTNT